MKNAPPGDAPPEPQEERGSRHMHGAGMFHAFKAFALATATGACFFFFWLGSFALSWVVLPLARFSLRQRPPIDRVRRCQDIVGRGFRLFIASMRVVRLVDFEPLKVKLDLPVGPFLMIANHPTLIDVTAVMAVHPRICCVAKTELFKSPLVGRLLRYSGHIEGGDVGSMEGAAVVQGALERLEGGQSVLIFPEGTRSPAYGLNRFKPGVFEISLRARVPVVPILITCDPPTLLKGQPWYALPKRTAAYRVTQLSTVRAETFGDDSLAAAALFHALYQEKIDAWKPGHRTIGGTLGGSSPAAWTSRTDGA